MLFSIAIKFLGLLKNNRVVGKQETHILFFYNRAEIKKIEKKPIKI